MSDRAVFLRNGIYEDQDGKMYELICTAFDTVHFEDTVVFRQMFAPFRILSCPETIFENTMNPAVISAAEESYKNTAGKGHRSEGCRESRILKYSEPYENSEGEILPEIAENKKVIPENPGNEETDSEKTADKGKNFERNISGEKGDLSFGTAGPASGEAEPSSDAADQLSLGADLSINGTDQPSANEVLMNFLDAPDFKKKREVLKKYRSRLDDVNISSMAMSLDLSLPGKDRDDDIDYILSYLAANERFSGERLRS